MTDPEWIRIQTRRDGEFRDRAGRSPVVHGERSYHRPGELLLDQGAEQELAALLADRYGGRRFDPGDLDHWRNIHGLPAESGDLNGRLAKVGKVLWTLPRRPETAHLPSLVRELRQRLKGGGDGARVDLNHVYFGEQHYYGEPLYQGGPGGEPFVVDPLDLQTVPANASADRPDLAVLDTGLPPGWQTQHPPLQDHLIPDGTDTRHPYQDGSTTLLSEAGHGLFICGLAHRVAPGLVIDPGRVLDSTGAGDDTSLGTELAQTTAPVISLSLGCYTDDDAPPPVLAAALADKGGDVAIVAAAGNNGSDRKFWPAACEDVIAVAGYDSTNGGRQRAQFSNFGPWVDVCAPAVRLRSAYLNGVWPAQDGTRTFTGWAGWSGTSFAAPLFAAEIARRLAAAGGSTTARSVAAALLAELEHAPWDGFGVLYAPTTDLTV